MLAVGLRHVPKPQIISCPIQSRNASIANEHEQRNIHNRSGFTASDNAKRAFIVRTKTAHVALVNLPDLNTTASPSNISSTRSAVITTPRNKPISTTTL